MNKSRYSLCIYTFVDGQGNFEVMEGKQVVNVGISTNVRKSLYQKAAGANKKILVLFESSTTYDKHIELVHEIDELRVLKEWFEFEPLASAIRRNCKKEGFVPYTIGGSRYIKDTLDEEPRGVLQFWI